MKQLVSWRTGERGNGGTGERGNGGTPFSRSPVRSFASYPYRPRIVVSFLSGPGADVRYRAADRTI